MAKSTRKLLLVALLSLLLVATLALAACNLTFGSGGNDGWGKVFTTQTAYAEAQSLGYTGSLEEFIASISGKDGTNGVDGIGIKSVVVNAEGHLVVTLSDDNTVDCGIVKGEKGDKGDTGAQGPKGDKGDAGEKGQDGTDGVTPQLKVGEDNFWYVSYDNGATWTCLNVKATGANGAQGEQGQQGVSIVSTAFDENGNTVITYSDGTTQTLEHNWEKFQTTSEVDCTHGGSVVYYCSDCGLMRLVVEEALGHDVIQHEAKAATCTSVGWNAYETCSRCDYTTKVEIPKISHNFVDGVCSVCGELEIEEATGLEYELSDDETYYVVTGIGTETRTRFAIPSEHNGKPVKEIGEEAFYNVAGSMLQYVVIPDSVGVIGAVAFMENYGLERAVLPSNLQSIGQLAFAYCESLTDIEIPTSVTEIGIGAFGFCDGLTSVNIPVSVTEIGTAAFTGCELESITVDANNPAYYAVGNCLIETETKTLISGFSNSVIPTDGSVTSLGYGAFGGCEDLTSIVLPDCIVSIGDFAFTECTNLESVVIPNSVEYVGEEVFVGCKHVIVYCEAASQPDGWDSDWDVSVSRVVWDCNNTNIAGDENIEEATGLEYELSDDETYYIVTGIGTETRTRFAIPSEHNGKPVKEIGEYAFFANDPYETTDIIEVIISDGITDIAEYAFGTCLNLTSITLPSTLTNMNVKAFYGCFKLVEVINKSDLKINVECWEYNSIDDGVNVKVPKVVKKEGTTDIVRSEDYIFFTINGTNYLLGYEGNGTDLILPENYGGLTYEIWPTAFAYNDKIESVEISDSVVAIGTFAFLGCNNLTSVEVSAGVTEIGSSAFGDCKNITNISFDNNSQLESIDDEVFAYCSSLTSIEIPASVTSIGTYAFYDCSSLASVTFGQNSELKLIGVCAFGDCSSIIGIELPMKVTSIGEAAFSSCSSLTSIEIPSSVTSIDYCAFYNCSSLESITVEEGNSIYHSVGNCLIETATKMLIVGFKNSIIPTDGSVTSLYDYAFYGCSGLVSIEIPASITSIGCGVFESCSDLTSITFSENSQLTSIGDRAFWDCSSFTSIEVPSSVASIGEFIFWGCNSLETLTVEAGNTVYHSEGNCLIETSTKTLITGCKYSIIPTDGSVVSIGSYAFDYCSSLISIVIPSSVISINECAFRGCSGLTSITIPSSVTSIGFYAFCECNSLTIYCEAESKPSGWSYWWNYSDCPVEWGYVAEE